MAKNIGKRLVKSPRVYIRDSGVTHALLGLGSKEDILGHPVAGQSWEGFVVENLTSIASVRTEVGFYRASGGAEIDLILQLPGRNLWAIEIELSLNPKPTKGFYSACIDLQPEASFVVYPGTERYRLKGGVEAISLFGLAEEIKKLSA